MNPSIRRAEPGEGPPLHALAAATFGLACPPSTPQAAIEAFIAEQLSAKRFEGYLADPRREVVVATVEGAFSGYAMLLFQEPTDPDVAAVILARPTAELSKFYVAREFHGSGLATALMLSTLNAARRRAAKSVWLGVNQQNLRANRFYGTSGFSPVGTKRFALGDRLEDDFVRERLL